MRLNEITICIINIHYFFTLFQSRRSTLDVQQKDKEEMVLESGKATERLRSISRNLAQTVENSSRTMSELVDSSKTMSDTNEEFKTMGAGISQARRLITKFGRRETTDRLLILLAAAFFFSVVFYILKVIFSKRFIANFIKYEKPPHLKVGNYL